MKNKEVAVECVEYYPQYGYGETKMGYFWSTAHGTWMGGKPTLHDGTLYTGRCAHSNWFGPFATEELARKDADDAPAALLMEV